MVHTTLVITTLWQWHHAPGRRDPCVFQFQEPKK